MRAQLVESDLIECVVTLAGGVFYSTGVNACILFLNNHKEKEHLKHVCLIDASNILTAQRAQNVMEPEDIQEIFDLYAHYENKVEKSYVASIDEIKAQGYLLTPTTYIEKKPQEIVPPEQVRKEYFEAVENVRKAEDELRAALRDGGFIK